MSILVEQSAWAQALAVGTRTQAGFIELLNRGRPFSQSRLWGQAVRRCNLGHTPGPGRSCCTHDSRRARGSQTEELRRRLAAAEIESEAERARARAAEEAAEKAKQREVPIRPQPPSGHTSGRTSGQTIGQTIGQIKAKQRVVP